MDKYFHYMAYYNKDGKNHVAHGFAHFTTKEEVRCKYSLITKFLMDKHKVPFDDVVVATIEPTTKEDFELSKELIGNEN